MKKFSVADISKIKRKRLSGQVPLEVFRLLRLVGIRGALPMGGRSVTAVVGREIGKSLGCMTVEDFLKVLLDLKIGMPEVVEKSERKIVIQLHDCMVCDGMDDVGEMVCDLEGAIIEGALASILNRPVSVKETQCNCNGDGVCEFTATIR